MTKIIAHRGSKGTHPENTLSAFQEAVDSQCDGVELDIQYTRDEALVVIHDGNVARTTNGKGDVDSFLLADIQKLDAGSWFDPKFSDQRIPTFEEVLELLQRNEFKGLLNIEIKTDEKDYKGIEQKIVTVMGAQKWSFAYMYSSFNYKSLEIVHEFDPVIPIAFILHSEPEKVALAQQTPFIEAIHPDKKWVFYEGEKLANISVPIRPWTVNDPVDMAYCFNKKLDGIHTDFPRKAVQVRKSCMSNEE